MCNEAERFQGRDYMSPNVWHMNLGFYTIRTTAYNGVLSRTIPSYRSLHYRKLQNGKREFRRAT